MSELQNIRITATPYATVTGYINVPNTINREDHAAMEEYVNDHWDSIEWDDPELDFCGTDLEFEEQ